MMNIRKTLLCLMSAFTILAACSNKDKGGIDPTPPTPEPTGDVTVYVTTTNRAKDLTKDAATFSQKDNMSPTTITLVPTTRYQVMDGFGAAITGSTAYNLLQMTAENRKSFLEQTFSPTKGYGFSYIRVSIGCSDFSLSEFTCCDKKGIENFALQSEDLTYVIPVLKEIIAINPSIKILGSPWTAPRWMKVNNLTDRLPYSSWTGGQLNPAYYADYATYFVKWIQALDVNGIKVYAITPQNEPLNRGNSASMYMGWEEQRDFVKTALGPAFQKAGITTKIYAFDHNYNYDNMADQQGYPSKIFQDANAASFFAGSAFHNYGGNREELNNVHAANPEKELLFTETSIGTWNSGRDLQQRLLPDMEEVALGTVNSWCKGVIVWNLMLDTDKGPNRPGGCQTCYGAVDISRSDFKTISRNSHYYIIGHMSSVVKPGAVRIATKGYIANGITYAAFENPDNTYAFVLCNNTSDDRTITISDGNHHFSYAVPAQSVTSYKWSK